MSSPTTGIPQRSSTNATRASTFSEPDSAIPDEDTSEVTKLFQERLQAWKHCCAYLEDYIVATEKFHQSQAKDFEKVLKTVSHPLKEGHHFDQSLGGVAGLFDNIRTNTQGISNSHHETAKALKGSILPTFERLHTEIKNKNKELTKGAGKGSKLVDKARNATQKQIELLGQHTAAFESTGGKVSAQDDPYVLQRGVWHRLNKQVQEENANRQDLLAVQSNFASFETHIIQIIQTGMGQFNTVISKQADLTKSMYGDMVGTAQRIPADFEWSGFLHRNSQLLIDPDVPARAVNALSFPNLDHKSTQPIIAGSLSRRGKVMRRYDINYYVVTASKFLHEFKSDDDFAKEPVPEVSLFLPDCVVGGVDGEKFVIKGKDVSKGKLGTSMSLSHDYSFKAHTPADALKWWDVVRKAAGQVTNELPPASVPSSPTADRHDGGFEDKKGIDEQVATTSGETSITPPTYTQEKNPHTAETDFGSGAQNVTAVHNDAAPPTPARPTETSTTTSTGTSTGPAATSAGPNEGVTTSDSKTKEIAA